MIEGRLLIFFLIVPLLFSTHCSTNQPSHPVDLVLVVIDTWRWDALSENNAGPANLTPNLDALANAGTRFSRAFASSPWTLPSVASLLTGYYPLTHGAFGNYTKVSPIRGEIPTLAEILNENGYQTLGVTTAPFLDPDFGFGRGFDSYVFLRDKPGRTIRARRAIDTATKLLSQASPGPVFLYLHLFDPHLPYDPPPPWRKRWTNSYDGPLQDSTKPLNPLKEIRAGSFNPTDEEFAYLLGMYYGEVAYTDHELGRFFKRIEKKRPGRQRMIVVTADHGEEFGEHGGWEHGHSMYSELTKVPLIILPPTGWSIKPQVVDSQVRLIDIAPTLLQAGSVEIPATFPGASLLGLMTGDPDSVDRIALSEKVHFGRQTTAYRKQNFTLVSYSDDNSFELYDLSVDPGEKLDLTKAGPEYQEKVNEMYQQLESLLLRLSEDSAKWSQSDREAIELDQELEQELRALGYLTNP